MSVRHFLLWATLLLPCVLGGCESVARGIAQGVMGAMKEPGEDTRLCDVEGKPFGGVLPYLVKQDGLPPIGEAVGERPEAKIIYVHGIGTHEPGHGTALMLNLANALDLDVRSPRPKRIVIASPAFSDKPLGELRITRLTNAERQRDLLFYELTWSPITQSEKDILAFDKDPLYQMRRTSLNQALRRIINDIAPDPLAYQGDKREPILTSISQSMCWALSTSWSDLPLETAGKSCGPDMPGFGSRLAIDDFVMISHSLGSRATIDAMQRLANLDLQHDPRTIAVARDFKTRKLQIFMLSNQLPLLESGREPQTVLGAADQYCPDGASKASQRFFAQTELIAFSDPNDLMSYPVPDLFAERYIDSRLCPAMTSVTINIARVSSLLGLGEAANPLKAHSAYDVDERVGALIARGAGNPDVAPIVADRCTFRPTADDLMQ
ncbi:MAG TPA: hypothetical protein VHL31_19915 [Geminicoccus sp.]|jgi:hypothetical protein|uniref:hypothetical protein n=1 Tax=Geminicoccus sp. TaxID=2024832 RepID=UPI002E3318AE|nr:hypothetical protein [Geminicoccus sp.]HEX2528549.1 hypothetical protein [Geminicoccus sp.]